MPRRYGFRAINLVSPRTGKRDNLADKARKLGISVWRFDPGGA